MHKILFCLVWLFLDRIYVALAVLNSLCTSDWPSTHRELPVSTSKCWDEKCELPHPAPARFINSNLVIVFCQLPKATWPGTVLTLPWLDFSQIQSQRFELDLCSLPPTLYDFTVDFFLQSCITGLVYSLFNTENWTRALGLSCILSPVSN